MSKIGRPKSDILNKKSKRLPLRLKETEYYWIKYVAEELNTTMTSLLVDSTKKYIRETFSEDKFAELAVKVIQSLGTGGDSDG